MTHIRYFTYTINHINVYFGRVITNLSKNILIDIPVNNSFGLNLKINQFESKFSHSDLSQMNFDIVNLFFFCRRNHLSRFVDHSTYGDCKGVSTNYLTEML